jgi:hypothetical protein
MIEQFSSLFARMKRHLDKVERAMGVLMVITGIGFLTGAVSSVSIWLLETFPALQNFGFDRHDQVLLDHADEQVRNSGRFSRTPSRRCRGCCAAEGLRYPGDRGEHLAAFAVATSTTPSLPYWSRKPGDAAKAVEIAVAQRIGQRQHLEPPVMRCISASSTRRMLRTVSSTRCVASLRSCS